MLKKVTDLTSQDFSKGLNTISNIFQLTKDQSPDMMDVKINFDGSLEKRKGSKRQNVTALTGTGSSGFSVDASGTLTSGLIAIWKLDETSGSRFDTYKGNTLLDVNTSGYASGIIGNALSLSNGTSHIYMANSSTVATGDVNFLVSTWFYLASTGRYTLVSKRDNPTGSTTVLLLHCDGADGSTTFTDNSLSAHTVTANGNAQIDTAQQKFGTASGLFDGTGDYLSIPDHADWDFGTGDFTVDCWVRFSVASGIQTFFSMGTAANLFAFYWDGTDLRCLINGASVVNGAWSPSANVLYHVAVVRSGTTVTIYVDGTSIGSGTSSGDIQPSGNTLVGIQDNVDLVRPMNGWLDEIRVSKGIAIWTSNFSPPTSAYSDPASTSNFEYWLYVNTDNLVTFEVSSSGLAQNGRVQATSFGAISTATWYNAIAWHDTADFIGISVNNHATSASYTSGVRSGSAGFSLGAISGGTLAIDGRVDHTMFWKDRAIFTPTERSNLYNSGSANNFSSGFGTETWGSFDFGATGLRYVIFSAGSGVFASQNIGETFTAIGTSQSSVWQHYERSKNVLVLTSDNYDTPLRWDGSGGTYMVALNSNAPVAKYSINHQGFLIMLNTRARPRLFAYEDVNTQLTGDWADSFDLPSTSDDQLTGAIVLRKLLYVSTKYRIFRLSYVGGNPDWSFQEIKSWGFVPNTIGKIFLKDIGEVAIGMSWDRRLRLFDGADDKIISDPIENDNMMCDFTLDKISNVGSGLYTANSVVDDNEQAYRLNLTIGPDSLNTTHQINFSGRTLSFYPYQNQPWQTMVMAEFNNLRYLLAGDRSGIVYMLDSGNLDRGTNAIDEHYDSSFLYSKSPSELSKAHRNDIYFTPTSSGTLYYQERIDFSNVYKNRTNFNITKSSGLVQIKKEIDIPSFQNVYQWRLTSSSSTADPWKLNRSDYFSDQKGIGHAP